MTGTTDARECAALVRGHARTFHAASRLLPAEKRRAAYALYAFCRIADDIVDGDIVDGDGARDTGSPSARLAAYADALDAALAGRPGGPVMRELWWAVTRFDVPAAALRELVAGVARDLEPTTYATWPELAGYCEGVASSVGEMCAHVFGVADGGGVSGADARRHAVRYAVRYARVLGAAMQLTNILRDVGEDARRGRCYLPADDLAAFGLTPDDVLRRRELARDERWRPFMAFEIGRARALYEAARPGLALLAPDSARCASACATGYAGILDAIVANGYDTISTRARLGRTARIAVLWRAWRGAAPTMPPSGPPSEGPYVARLA